MPNSRRLTSGRTVLLLVLAALVIVVGAAVYLVIVRVVDPDSLSFVAAAESENGLRMEQARRLSLLLAILLLSALLILVFVLGAYLLIRVGRLAARTRTRVGGAPTEYVDAWQQYRLTEEQISAATSNLDGRAAARDDDSGGSDPGDGHDDADNGDEPPEKSPDHGE